MGRLVQPSPTARTHRQHPACRPRGAILCCRGFHRYCSVTYIQRPPTNPAILQGLDDSAIPLDRPPLPRLRYIPRRSRAHPPRPCLRSGRKLCFTPPAGPSSSPISSIIRREVVGPKVPIIGIDFQLRLSCSRQHWCRAVRSDADRRPSLRLVLKGGSDFAT
jgi:hypothetical protein